MVLMLLFAKMRTSKWIWWLKSGKVSILLKDRFASVSIDPKAVSPSLQALSPVHLANEVKALSQLVVTRVQLNQRWKVL